MSPVAASEHPLFGHAARALAARCLVPHGAATPPNDGQARLAWRDGPAARGLRAALREAGATLRETGRGELRATCDAALLEELADDPAAAALLATHRAALAPPGPPRLVGVLNVTPDSFSDGGAWLAPERALERALALVAAGAELVDVGGESTRPGAAPVTADVELERVVPVLAALAEAGVPCAIDTSKALVARRAIELGARMVNDVSAGTADPDMLPAVAQAGVDYVAMHMRGTPRDMQRAPWYEDPVAEILEFLRARAAACLAAGIRVERLLLDPGFGFGKRVADNVQLLSRLGELRSLARPLYVGVSRKSFLGRLAGEPAAAPGAPGAPGERAPARAGGSAAAAALCVLGGAELVRVHDVALAREAVAVARALRDAREADAG